MSNGVKMANVNAERQAMPQPQEFRVVDAIDMLEMQQGDIFRFVTGLNLRLSNEEPAEEIGMDAISYRERLQRLIKYNDEILFRLNGFNDRF